MTPLVLGFEMENTDAVRLENLRIGRDIRLGALKNLVEFHVYL